MYKTLIHADTLVAIGIPMKPMLINNTTLKNVFIIRLTAVTNKVGLAFSYAKK